MIHGDVAIWDADAHTLRLVNASQGAITRDPRTPAGRATSPCTATRLFAVAADGRVVRLDPIK